MQDDHEDYVDEDFEDEPEYYYCLRCDWTGDSDPGQCPRCSGWSIEAVY